jgi:hypothetical protein
LKIHKERSLRLQRQPHCWLLTAKVAGAKSGDRIKEERRLCAIAKNKKNWQNILLKNETLVAAAHC